MRGVTKDKIIQLGLHLQNLIWCSKKGRGDGEIKEREKYSKIRQKGLRAVP